MKHIYKLFLAINATSWVVVIFGIKNEWAIALLPSWFLCVLLLFIPVILSGISIFLSYFLKKDNIEDCCELKEANSSFLPIYLGYFFVGLNISEMPHLIFVYLIILIFTYVAQTQYFNPIFLLFGYRFYKAKTAKGTWIFIITKGNLRRADEVYFNNLRRINDTTFISRSNKDESTDSKN